MCGEFIAVWTETQREIWSALADHDDAPHDLFCELYRALVPALKAQPSVELLADIIDDADQSRKAFEDIAALDLQGEIALVRFIESAYWALDELVGVPLTDYYFSLVESFAQKFSLRYNVAKPLTLSPTLSGMFTSLLSELRSLSQQNKHLANMLADFDGAIRDINADPSEARIRTCIQKQVNLLEALARLHPTVKGTDLSAMCGQLNTWPHTAIRSSLASLYGFTSDYPGIRHAGNPDSAIRVIDLRDMLAVSILLAGFTPYLSQALDPLSIYRRY